MKDKIVLGHRGALMSQGVVGKRGTVPWGPLCHRLQAGLPFMFAEPIGFSQLGSLV